MGKFLLRTDGTIGKACALQAVESMATLLALE
jgi:hypothetical protein